MFTGIGATVRARLTENMPVAVGKSRVLAMAALAVAIVLLDRWTKDAVIEALPVHSGRNVIPGFFDLVHTRNTGIAFSLFADAGPFVAEVLLPIVSALAIVFVVAYFWRHTSEASGVRWALALILAGAVGNLYDRMLFGYVTDFLLFYVGDWSWPAFNVADSAITVGAGLLLLDAARKPSTTPDASAS